MDIETLHSDILSALPTDPTAQAHLLDTAESWWSVDESSLLWLHDHIYIPDSKNLHLRILQYKHDHPTSGHFGQNRTLELIHRNYAWPGLRSFITNYVRTCMTCAQAKAPHHRPYGLLKQLPIPEKPWNSISMDFIEQLPAFSGFMAILVVVDQLSKQSISIPTHDVVGGARGGAGEQVR